MVARHILEVGQFSKAELETILSTAEKMKQLVEKVGGNDRLTRKVIANLFYEPSTRTSSSFAAAMYRLGGKVISINDVQYSSVAKGESLEDTIRTLEQYADCIVLRHPEIGAAKRAAAVSHVPIINAGDGAGDHPTQALLDLFTILQEKQQIDNLTITMVGDLKYGRTVHSLAEILNHFDVTLQFVSPPQLAFPDMIKSKLKNQYSETDDLESVIKKSDVLYVTRVQKERFENIDEYEKLKNHYIITNKLLEKAKKKLTIMHPLPRVGEIAYEVDKDPRAAYFRQMKNGMYMRMALLDHLLTL